MFNIDFQIQNAVQRNCFFSMCASFFIKNALSVAQTVYICAGFWAFLDLIVRQIKQLYRIIQKFIYATD